jgi:Flp pilus assembly protein TadG
MTCVQRAVGAALQGDRGYEKMNRDTEIAAQKPLSRSGDFVREEDGTILMFTAVILIILLVVAGMGVDIMRFESTRTELQQTLDRSTLAAASLTQELDSEDVVRDYFDKAGLGDKLTSVIVTNGLNFRNVRAEAEAETNPIFMDLLDPSSQMQLQAKGLSIAEQRITNVEIMLVLDVSGSMAGSKLTNLKNAASEFVENVLEADGEGRISIGIVPYNGQVNLPQYLQNLYNMTEDHGETNVNCSDLPSSVYSGLGMSTSLAMPVTGYVDTYSSTTRSSSYLDENNSSAVPYAPNRWCMPNANTMVRAPTNNINQLQAHINGLTAGGATSINAGMKWGMALLDPGSRDVISGMIAQGQTPAVFSGRPFDYVDDESMKVVVLMTDGEHFPEERLNDGYRSGNAPIWRASDGNYSIYHNRSSTSYDYWVPHRNEWRTSPWQYGSSSPVQQTWPQMWERQRMSWVAWQLYGRAFGNSTAVYNNTMDMFRTKTEVPDMNDQLQSVCNRARDNNVIVYGIAFEAPPGGAAQIEACASTPGHYFDATGLEIQSAFRAIASNISQLRLTQ